MKKIVRYSVLLSFFTLSCGKQTLKTEFPAKTNTNLKYFGYTLIDVGWDDPTDKENKTNYIDEVSSFSNVADILVIDPNENIIDRINIFNAQNVKAMLHLNEIFFEQKSEGGHKSGVIYGLRADYQTRWSNFVTANDLINNTQKISCFYIGEEPSWNGITENEFKTACDYVKESISDVPIFSVEAYLDVENMYTPNSVDWIGFDHYFLKEPSTSVKFMSELNILKSKLKPHQKIFLILDAHWIKILHGSSGISKVDMDFIARDYYNIANADTSIIGILGYFWPNGFDIKKSVGARSLPQNVLDEHQRIGKSITGK